MVGDVVVVQGKWLLNAVQFASLSRANRAGHEYTHAGIYVGQGVLIDAMRRGGIARRSLAAYVNRPVGLRRLPDISDQVRISAHRGRSFQAIVDGVSDERGRHFRLIVDDVSA